MHGKVKQKVSYVLTEPQNGFVEKVGCQESQEGESRHTGPEAVLASLYVAYRLLLGIFPNLLERRKTSCSVSVHRAAMRTALSSSRC